MGLFIAICDDEKRISAELEKALLTIFSTLNVKCEIDVYFTGEELCTKMAAGAQYDLIFLDIEFAQNAINGVAVGQHIRDTYPHEMVSIVYISWEMKYSMQLFDIRPLNFLVKPLDFLKVEQIIKTYLNISTLWTRHLTYKIGHNSHKTQIKDIVYVESEKRKLILHLANGNSEEFYGTLKEVYEEQLQKFDFLFIHASYAVNYDYVVAVKYDEVLLTTGVATLPVSQHKRKEARAHFYAITEKRRV